ncbi:hypothetical protein Tco_0833191 [Tanacetum coccineum]
MAIRVLVLCNYNDLRTIELGSFSITEYFHKINRIADSLANIDSPVDEKNLIAYAINNVGDKYEGVVDMIRHHPLSLNLIGAPLQRKRLDRKTIRQIARDSSSFSLILIAVNPNNSRNTNSSNNQACCIFSERVSRLYTWCHDLLNADRVQTANRP